MSSTTPLAPTLDYHGQPTEARKYLGLSAVAWVQILVLGLAMAALYRHSLIRLWLKTNPFTGEPNWGHAFVVPLIGIYYLYLNRERLLSAPVRTNWWGLVILVGGIVFYLLWVYPGQNHFFQDIGLVMTLFGVVLFVCGWQVMKIAWFPIVFLVCAIPWPQLFYSQLALPLQKLAAEVAVVVLRTSGVFAARIGTKIQMGTGEATRWLNVAEACAGLKSLMTFMTIAAAVAFLSSRPFWQKLIITISAVPIAIACNVMRVSGQGLLDHYWSREVSEGFAHQFVGLVMLVPAFFLILLVAWVLDRLFIEEADDRALAAAAAVAGPQSMVIDVPRAATPMPARPAAAPVKPAAPPVVPPRPAVAAPRTAAPKAPAAPTNQAEAARRLAATRPGTPRPAPRGPIPPRPAGPPVNRPGGPGVGRNQQGGSVPRPGGAEPQRPEDK